MGWLKRIIPREKCLSGFPRLQALLNASADLTQPIDVVLAQLTSLTGAQWQQEDDVTLFTLLHTKDDC
jgi:hypothetical protein